MRMSYLLLFIINLKSLTIPKKTYNHNNSILHTLAHFLLCIIGSQGLGLLLYISTVSGYYEHPLQWTLNFMNSHNTKIVLYCPWTKQNFNVKNQSPVYLTPSSNLPTFRNNSGSTSCCRHDQYHVINLIGGYEILLLAHEVLKQCKQVSRLI